MKDWRRTKSLVYYPQRVLDEHVEQRSTSKPASIVFSGLQLHRSSSCAIYIVLHAQRHRQSASTTRGCGSCATQMETSSVVMLQRPHGLRGLVAFRRAMLMKEGSRSTTCSIPSRVRKIAAMYMNQESDAATEARTNVEGHVSTLHYLLNEVPSGPSIAAKRKFFGTSDSGRRLRLESAYDHQHTAVRIDTAATGSKIGANCVFCCRQSDDPDPVARARQPLAYSCRTRSCCQACGVALCTTYRSGEMKRLRLKTCFELWHTLQQFSDAEGDRRLRIAAAAEQLACTSPNN